MENKNHKGHLIYNFLFNCHFFDALGSEQHSKVNWMNWSTMNVKVGSHPILYYDGI